MQIRGKRVLPQNKCGPGQPPEPHRTWISCLAILPLGRRMTASARQRSIGEQCRIYQSQLPIRNLAITNSATACGGQRPCPARGAEKGEEAAMPGQPVALARVFWNSPGNSPSRITGCRWLCRNHSGKLRKFHVSLNPLSVRSLRLATLKTLRPLCRNCGRCVFPVEDRGKLRINPSLIQSSRMGTLPRSLGCRRCDRSPDSNSDRVPATPKLLCTSRTSNGCSLYAARPTSFPESLPQE